MRKEIDIYRRQTMAFRRKFGRDMGPNDPFFFDPHADTPRFRQAKDADSVLAKLEEMFRQAGADAAHVYAFRKTGGLLPPGTVKLTLREIAEWKAAVAEYRRGIRQEEN